jgi:CTP synthase
MNQKFVFITGGVVSSLGKGLTSAGIGLLLESQQLKVSMLKLDPYLNVDPGTMNPFEHGEVYVTDDGAETDLDLGHYYRLTNSKLTKLSNTTSGKIYDSVIRRERKGEYLGKTIQVVPHITDEIKSHIRKVAEEDEADVLLVEIGGTAGDIESLPFLEAIRQFRLEHPKSCLNIHLTYVPYLKAAQELKTKPTQHSAQVLREIGIIPDIILSRCENPLSKEIKDKISLFCSVRNDCVFDVPDVESIYAIPLLFASQKLDQKVLELLEIPAKSIDLSAWEKLIEKQKQPKHPLKIAVVGKYILYKDAYKSLYEALNHAAIHLDIELDLKMIESDKIQSLEILSDCDGILVPGGFGQRGFEGKILACQYARENKIPYFGICLGMQVQVVEFARNVLSLPDANSTEMDPITKNPVISLLSEQGIIENLGGTMRLGSFTCEIKPDSLAEKIYRSSTIDERHRHRYEFNQTYKDAFESQGLTISGQDAKRKLCEIVELNDHPFMIGVQFHPEFKSKPLKPHPLFENFLSASLTYKNQQKGVHG